jgi:hypothetical protein
VIEQDSAAPALSSSTKEGQKPERKCEAMHALPIFLLDRFGSFAAVRFDSSFRLACHFPRTLARDAETNARPGVIEKFNP